MKPVAWYPVDAEGLRLGDNISFCSSVPIPTKGFSISFAKAISLYTADQLREAQVKVLREAAKRFSGTNAQWVINHMADELEKDDAIRGLA